MRKCLKTRSGRCESLSYPLERRDLENGRWKSPGEVSAPLCVKSASLLVASSTGGYADDVARACSSIYDYLRCLRLLRRSGASTVWMLDVVKPLLAGSPPDGKTAECASWPGHCRRQLTLLECLYHARWRARVAIWHNGKVNFAV